MKRLTITLAVGALLLLLCSNCSFMDKMYAAQKIDQAATPVPFTTLENYFVRNDVDCSKQQRLIIDNKAEFEKYFGMAAHMGGLPTDVNWNKQYVIAVILPVTNHATMVTPLEVKQSPGNVIFKYQVYRGGKTSYTLMPFAAVALNKGVDPQQIQVFFIEK